MRVHDVQWSSSSSSSRPFDMTTASAVNSLLPFISHVSRSLEMAEILLHFPARRATAQRTGARAFAARDAAAAAADHNTRSLNRLNQHFCPVNKLKKRNQEINAVFLRLCCHSPSQGMHMHHLRLLQPVDRVSSRRSWATSPSTTFTRSFRRHVNCNVYSSIIFQAA